MQISQLHHYSMKCASQEALNKVKHFYCTVLGLPIAAEWADGVMIACGSGFIEVFSNGQGDDSTGAIRHIAFQVDDAPAYAKTVTAAGYDVFLGPKEITIPAHACIVFCHGPLGEQVEFFQPLSGAEEA